MPVRTTEKPTTTEVPTTIRSEIVPKPFDTRPPISTLATKKSNYSDAEDLAFLVRIKFVFSI
jgi:hypothetical protein